MLNYIYSAVLIYEDVGSIPYCYGLFIPPPVTQSYHKFYELIKQPIRDRDSIYGFRRVSLALTHI